MTYELRNICVYTTVIKSSHIKLDTEDFRNLSQFPYYGQSEEDFVRYINDFGKELQYSEELPEDVRFTLMELYDNVAWQEIYDSRTFEEDEKWIELGETDEEYESYGNFNVFVRSNELE